MMKEIGLHPSDTGFPGGKETGQSVSHFIIEGGPFSVAAAELIKTGWQLRYGDVAKSQERKPPVDVKFSCPQCSATAKAKPEVRLTCTDCGQSMACATTALMAA